MTSPASSKDESDYKIIDGIEYVKMSRVKMFISIAKQQAVQTALEWLLEQKVDASWNEVQSTNEGFEVERLIREDAVPATAIEAVIAAAQARKDERGAEDD